MTWWPSNRVLRGCRARRGLLAPLLLAVAVETASPFTLEDDRGESVELAAPAERVVSLAPFITELIYAVGAGDKLVAAGDYSDYPDAARSLPRVGDAFNVNLEALLALHPDLVMVWRTGNNPRVTERLGEFGIPVFVLEPRELRDIPRALRRIGRLLGTERAARNEAKAFTRAIDAIRNRYAGRQAVSVFYQISRRPLMTLNGEHMFTALLHLCGGRNIFEDSSPIASTVNREQVLARDPDVILISSTMQGAQELIDDWRRFSALTATRLDNIYPVDADLINRQTPRLVDGARQICERLDQARDKLEAARGE
jgi:iron complex transport system substrate-binding protein